jgi:hypothetical protein
VLLDDLRRRGLASVAPGSGTRLIGLNGLVGTVYALFYLRFGIEGCVAGHFRSDLVWYAMSRSGSGRALRHPPRRPDGTRPRERNGRVTEELRRSAENGDDSWAGQNFARV